MYQLTTTEYILRTSDGAYIPQDTENHDYADYLAWLEDGNAPLPAEQPSAFLVPQACTRRQGRLALLAHGYLDDVESLIAAITDPAERRAAQIEYEADTWERSNPVVQSMWSALGGTPEQLDDLFVMAVTL